MIAIIIMPVMRFPRSPVTGVISPPPRRIPPCISWYKNNPDNWPGSYLHRCCSYNSYWYMLCYHGIACVTGIRCITCGFFVIRFNNIIFPIEVFIPYKLHIYIASIIFLHCNHRYILKFIFAYCYFKNNIVHISCNVIINYDIIDFIIAVQVKVIYFQRFIIQRFFKTFKRWRFLK